MKGIAEGVTLAGYSSNVSPNVQYRLENLSSISRGVYATSNRSCHCLYHIPEGCVGMVDCVGVGIAGVCNVERETAGVGAVDFVGLGIVGVTSKVIVIHKESFVKDAHSCTHH